MNRRTAPILVLATLLVVGFRPASASEVKQQKSLWEIGLYLGVYLPPSDHELYDPSGTHREMDGVNFDVGLRGGYYPWYFLGVELEAGLLPVGTTGASAIGYTARAHAIGQYPVWKRLCPFVVLGGGLLGVASDADALGSDLDGMLYWGLGAKYYLTDFLAVRLDIRHDISVGRGEGLSNHWEALVGVSWVFGWRAPGDRDGDGVVDSRDRCPDTAAKTPDGCPTKDTDGDGVADDRDRCPKEPANTKDGCPIVDGDGDGLTGEADKCPDEPETKNGYRDGDGCPDELPDAVKKFTGAIRGVNFASGKARIRPSSFKVLDRAVAVLKEYGDLRLTIRGHTDSTGGREKNVTLSRRRAEAVKDYLVSKGIAADRLTTEGLGPDEPVADNATAAGRAKNRRIEFRPAP